MDNVGDEGLGPVDHVLIAIHGSWSCAQPASRTRLPGSVLATPITISPLDILGIHRLFCLRRWHRRRSQWATIVECVESEGCVVGQGQLLLDDSLVSEIASAPAKLIWKPQAQRSGGA